MYPLPGRLGGLGAGACLLPAPRLPPPIPSGAIVPPNVLPSPQYAAVGDSFGAIQIPAQPAPQIVGYSPVLAPQGSGVLPPGDPALGMILSFLYAWLVIDGNANVPWTAAYNLPLIKSPFSLFTHNPEEGAFSVDYLPALYLWRDDERAGKFEHAADDWYDDTSTLKLLWALPLGDQFRFKDRSLYANQFAKSVYLGIERGMTPSWVQPGDPNPQSRFYGSVLGQYLNMRRLQAGAWRRKKLKILMSNNAPPMSCHAVEILFEAVESANKPDLRRFPRLGQLDQRISNPVAGSSLEHEIDN
jgi:hypothetical protein